MEKALRYDITGDSRPFQRSARQARQAGVEMNRDLVAGAAASALAMRETAQAATLQANAMRAASHNSRQLMFQLVDIGQSIPLAFQSPLYAMQNLGFQVAQIGQLYAGQGGLTQAAKDSARQIGRFATGAVTKFPLVTAAIAAAGVALVGMQHEINETAGISVSMTDVLVGNWQVIKGGIVAAAQSIYSVLQPAINAVAPLFSAAWNAIRSGFKIVTNALIAGWVTVYDYIKAVWNNFPAIMGDVAYQAGDLFLKGLNVMLNMAIAAVKKFYLTFLNPLAGALKALGQDTLSKYTGGNIFDGFKADFSMGENPNAGASAKVLGNVLANAKQNFSTDYLGEYFDAVSKAARANAELGQSAEDAGKAINAAGASAKDPWKGLRDATSKATDAIRKAKETLGQGFGGILNGLLNKTLSWKDALVQAGQALLKYLNQANLAGGGQGLFGGGLFGGIMQGLLGFANGGAFGSGGVTAFAGGGAFTNSIVNQPTLFKFANGTGLMGESGPEGILPLRRNSQGQLGVMASNQNQPSTVYAPVYNIDARGADQAAVTRIERGLAERDRTFDKRVDLRNKTAQARGTRG